ncbi:MAG: mannosyltransferase family protein [Spirulinaceae cyanobacterium]
MFPLRLGCPLAKGVTNGVSSARKVNLKSMLRKLQHLAQASRTWLMDETHTGRFPWALWLFSRLLIFVAFFGLAPLLNAEVAVGSDAFVGGDGQWYLRIASEGYTIDPDGLWRSPAFFPLYPLLIRGLAIGPMAPEVAGFCINNLAFLGAVWLLHHWLQQQYHLTVARWAVAVLVLCPFSLFGTVLYTEGLFLLLTVAALWAFETRRLGVMTLSGFLATAVRPPGLALIPALLLQAVREKRPAVTYGGIIAMAGGLMAYSLYCWLQLGDPLIFSAAQDQWGRTVGDLQPWLRLLTVTVVGETNYHARGLARIDHPLAVVLVTGLAIAVWCRRDRLGRATPYWTFFVVCAAWIVGDYGLLRLGGVFGGAMMLWQLRRHLTGAVLLYGFCGLGLLLLSGSDLSAERLAYGIVPLTIAAGVGLDQHPRVGYGLLPWSAIVLLTIATQLGQGILVAGRLVVQGV